MSRSSPTTPPGPAETSGTAPRRRSTPTLDAGGGRTGFGVSIVDFTRAHSPRTAPDLGLAIADKAAP
ncbi:hypothetical protein ACIPLC_03355 [Kitasatospora sp. NPDC086801]|uniref:hypothetical protein n=1 Tax=Kitasatospora sp. NPDC086801 TaxID=3364066 RepID=UPI0037F1F5CD